MLAENFGDCNFHGDNNRHWIGSAPSGTEHTGTYQLVLELRYLWAAQLLNADNLANLRYLNGLQIPPTFPQVITLEHLMTQTAGFEDHVIGLLAKTPDKLRPLAELMSTQMPRRVFPPGQAAGFITMTTGLQAAEDIVFGPTPTLRVALTIWAAAASLTLGSLPFGILAWRHGWWRLAGRIGFTLVLLGSIGCVLWLNHWNLLGWKY